MKIWTGLALLVMLAGCTAPSILTENAEGPPVVRLAISGGGGSNDLAGDDCCNDNLDGGGGGSGDTSAWDTFVDHVQDLYSKVGSYFTTPQSQVLDVPTTKVLQKKGASQKDKDYVAKLAKEEKFNKVGDGQYQYESQPLKEPDCFSQNC